MYNYSAPYLGKILIKFPPINRVSNFIDNEKKKKKQIAEARNTKFNSDWEKKIRLKQFVYD